MASTNLNILQRGILQKIAVAAVYFSCFLAGGFLIDWLEKRRFATAVVEARKHGIINSEDFGRLKPLIAEMDETAAFALIIVVLICAFVSWFLMRWAARRNWSWPITLPKVVEFRWALEQLGIVAPEERVDFVRKYNLRVFIALSPLVHKEQEAVPVKLYAFAHDKLLGSNEVFTNQTGRQRLCLDADDYERLLQEQGQKTDLAYSARIVALGDDVTALKGANSLHVADIVKLTEEKETLLAENAELRRKQQTAPGREGRVETINIRRIPFWRVVVPLINRLIEEAEPGIQYSRSDIQTAFDAEVKKFPALQPAIKKELHTFKQKEPDSEFDLTGWGMDSIRAALGDLAKKDPGATKKH